MLEKKENLILIPKIHLKNGLIKKGIDTYENDQHPEHGFFGKQSQQIRLSVCLGARIDQTQPKIVHQTDQAVPLITDESKAYNRVEKTGRKHFTGCHLTKDYALDGVVIVLKKYIVILMKAWTGLRNFLFPFHGAHKKYWTQYVAIFENTFNFKEHFEDIIRAMIIPYFFIEHYCSP